MSNDIPDAATTPLPHPAGSAPQPPAGAAPHAQQTAATPGGAPASQPAAGSAPHPPAAPQGTAPAAHPQYPHPAGSAPHAQGGGSGIPPVYPPAGPAATPPRQSPEARTGSRALAITLGVVGGVVVLGAMGLAAGSAVASTAFRGDGELQTLTAGTTGVREVEISSSSGEFRVEFADVDEATLEGVSDGGDWSMRRDGDTLVIDSPRQWFRFGFDWNYERNATLTLPRSLEGVDLDADVSAGSFDASGAFGAVSYELSAGAFEIEGSATSLDADMSAGSSVIELSDLRTASFEVSAGDLWGDLTGGEAPDAIDIDVSAGSVELQLPDVPYAVTRDSAFGDVTSNLDESSRAPRTIDIELAAGDVTLAAS